MQVNSNTSARTDESPKIRQAWRVVILCNRQKTKKQLIMPCLYPNFATKSLPDL
ncbi:hypothetical protein VHP8226_01255 [Vibrio hippocampi]|uniref:Uncharacterized protein n=1 Tax=Vibrio hippocampi TaxID=654686 RepID=A0ABN8DGP6_9VIBR|nr:hypothetical protein VHP8226_01255 [Vibrio hippocampi]